MEIQILTTQYLSQDCTASLWRCSKNTWRLTSSVKITSEPAATSWAELYVADGFNFARRNRACRVSFKKKKAGQANQYSEKTVGNTSCSANPYGGALNCTNLKCEKFSLPPSSHPNNSILFSLQQSHNIVIFYSISLMFPKSEESGHVSSVWDKILVYVHNPYPYP